MATETDVQDLIANITEGKNPPPLKAVMGKPDGTVNAGGYNVYVTIAGSGQIMTVFNERVPRNPFRRVLVGYDQSSRYPNLMQVLSFDDSYTDQPTPNLVDHGESHEWWGYDPVRVGAEQITPGLVLPIPDTLTVQLYGMGYYLDGTYHQIDNKVINLTSYVPASGAQWGLIQVDADGVISLELSSVVDGRGLLLPEDIPAATSGNKAVFAVKLYAGQTEFIKTKTETDFFDVRFTGGASGLTFVLDPNRIAVTDAAGTLTTNDNLYYDTTTGILRIGDFDAGVGPYSGEIGYMAEVADSIYMVKDGAGALFSQQSYSNVLTDPNIFQFVKGGGALGAVAVLLDDMEIGSIRAGGVYDDDIGAGVPGLALSQGMMTFIADGDWSPTSEPVRIEFWTTPAGSTSEALAMTIGSDGMMYLGNTNPARVLITDTNTGAIVTDDWFIYDNTNYELTLGDPTGGSDIRFAHNSGIATLLQMNTWGTGLTSQLKGTFANGTKALPTVAIANDRLFRLSGAGYDGTDPTGIQVSGTAAEVRFTATETYSTTAHGSKIGLYTTPNTTSTLVLGWEMGPNANITGIGQYFIDGSANQIQLLVQGNATQTAALVTFENSAGTDLWAWANSGAATITPSSDVTALTITHPGTPTVGAILFNDAPGSLTGTIGYGGNIAFSNISAEAVASTDIGSKIYIRKNLANVWAAVFQAYISDTTTGARNVFGFYGESLIHNTTNQNQNAAFGAQILAGNNAAVTLTRSTAYNALINNANASAVTSAAYLFQGNINSNTGSITSLFGLRIGNTANANFVQGTVPTATGIHINPIGASTSSFGIFIDNITAGSIEQYSIYTSNGAISFLGSRTKASAASMVWDAIEFRAATLTLTGTTNITTATGVNYHSIARPTLTNGSSLTVTNSATLYISNSPLAGGSVTITNAYSIWVDAGISRFDDQVIIIGSADRIQSITRANATQTTSLAEWQNSSGTALVFIGGAGRARFTVGADIFNSNTNTVFNGSSNQYALTIRNSSATTNAFVGIEFQDSGALTIAGIAVRQTDLTNHYGGLHFQTKGSSGSAVRFILDENGLVTVGSAVGTGRFQVTGSTDIIQERILAHSSQTALVATWETSAGAVNISFDNNGGMVINEQGTASGDLRWESDTEANMLFGDANGDTDGALYFGGTTNGVKVKKTGLMSFLGTSKIENYLNIATEAYGVPVIRDDVALTGQTAAIGTTNFTNAGAAGTYRVNYYLETTTADAGAGTIQLTIAWTDDAGATTFVTAALALTATGRLASTPIFIRLASGSISYAVALASGAFGTSAYALYMSCERLS